jgi:ABC-2 type transport system permease protein
MRANWLTALSYRLNMFFTYTGLVVGIVPLYFVSHALQPMMASTIKTESPEYFAFLIVGIVTYQFVNTSVNALHGALAGEISSGSFEALVSTPTPLPALLLGMISQNFSMTVLRTLVLSTAALVFGAHIVWSGVLPALMILGLIVLSYLPFGIFAASLVLAFRATGPFPGGIVTASALLGGVYYPTQVIPSWLLALSKFIPLTYGLRALRRSLLDGAPLSASTGDLAVVALATVVLMTLSLTAFLKALGYAKHTGTLTQY